MGNRTSKGEGIAAACSLPRATLPANMAGQVYIEREGGLAWVVFDHVERRNAITAEMWQQIPVLARQLDEDDSVRVVILRGAGEVAFVSGADISEFEQRRTGAGAAEYDRQNDRAFQAIAQLSRPVIAMVHGFCIGGGRFLDRSSCLLYIGRFILWHFFIFFRITRFISWSLFWPCRCRQSIAGITFTSPRDTTFLVFISCTFTANWRFCAFLFSYIDTYTTLCT